MLYVFQPRSSHPSIKRPIAAIQLPATRTATRVQAPRSDTTNAATMATTVKTAVAIPTSDRTPPPACAMAVPLISPWSRPIASASPATSGSGSLRSTETSTPITRNAVHFLIRSLTPQPRFAGSTLRSGKLTAGNALAVAVQI